MLLNFLLFISYTISICPRYSLLQNPTPFQLSNFFALLVSGNNYDGDGWPANLTFHCAPEVKAPSNKKIWQTNLPTKYGDNNDTATFIFAGLHMNSQHYKSPICWMYNNQLCFKGLTVPVYFPKINFLHSNKATIDVCKDQPIAFKLVGAPSEYYPYISNRFRFFGCVNNDEFKLYHDTVVVEDIGTIPKINCVVYNSQVSYHFNYVKNSSTCMGLKKRIMYPVDGAEFYYSPSKYYRAELLMHPSDMDVKCFPTTFAVMRDVSGRIIMNVDKRAYGRSNYTCEVSGDPSSKIHFYVTIMELPSITTPLVDCMNIDNYCALSFDYYRGSKDVNVQWLLNGEDMQENSFVEMGVDKKTVRMTLTESIQGNVQVIISNKFGNQMTGCYVKFTAAPFFEIDLPKYKTVNETENNFMARVHYEGVDEIKIYWLMNEHPIEKTAPHVKASVNVTTHECHLEFDYHKAETIMDTFVCVFRVGPYEIRSTKLTIVTSESIRSTVSLMIPVLGVLAAAVILALILIPVCVVYRNRHSKAYRLAMVERQCGLNPDKDFKTLNDFGENSRRQARHPNYSILRSGAGSNEGSSFLNNNIPDIREQASFLNDYSA